MPSCACPLKPPRFRGLDHRAQDVDRASFDRMLDDLASAKRRARGEAYIPNNDPHSRTYRGPHKGRERSALGGGGGGGAKEKKKDRTTAASAWGQ